MQFIFKKRVIVYCKSCIISLGVSQSDVLSQVPKKGVSLSG